MSSAGITLDLSNAPGNENEFGSLRIPKGARMDATEDVTGIIASNSNIINLNVAPPSLLVDVAGVITYLSVPFNNLTTLNGIENFPCLEVLEVHHNQMTNLDLHNTSLLRKLLNLRELDLSHNQLRLVDFESSLDEKKNELLYLSKINLSHNHLIEVPDLRSLPSLLELNLNYNKIEDLTDVESRLPLVSIQCLKLRKNAIQSVSNVVPLTALAQTLAHLEIFNNPFSAIPDADKVRLNESASPHRKGSLLVPGPEQPFWYRPFILFLLPLLETVDMVEFTRSEKAAANQLFRNNQKNLTKDLLELMNPQQKDELVDYLMKHVDHVLAPAELLDILLATEEEEEEEGALDEVEARRRGSSISQSGSLTNRDYTPPQTIVNVRSALKGPNELGSEGATAHPNSGASKARTRSMASNSNANGSTTSIPHTPSNSNSTTTKTAAYAEVVQAIQTKVKSLSSVVEVLYNSDMIRRKFAVIKIQKVWRGALCRMHLSPQESMKCSVLRERLRASRSTTSHARSSAPPVSPTSQANMQEVLHTMKGLQEVITNMWGDLADYRVMLEREQRRAAITIQRYYRGYVARQEWRILKSDYEEFVQSLSSFVLLMQRAGRGFLARRHVQLNLAPRMEVYRLRNDVRTLQEQIVELRVLVEKKDINSVRATQPRLSIDYATEGRDPREKMEEIIRNYEQGSGSLGHRYAEEMRKRRESKQLEKEQEEEKDMDETPDRELSFESEPFDATEEDEVDEENEHVEDKEDETDGAVRDESEGKMSK